MNFPLGLIQCNFQFSIVIFFYSGVYFWPGSEAAIKGRRPSIYKAYNESVPFTDRIDTVMSWFTQEHLDFVALYFHEPDATGHAYGPDSQEIVENVSTVLHLD